MHHAEKTVTIYRKGWDADKAVDTYSGTVVRGVSFFSRVVSTVTTDGLTAANEAVCRIPIGAYSGELKNGDLICEGSQNVAPQNITEIQNPFTIVGVTMNTTGKEPHIKVVAK